MSDDFYLLFSLISLGFFGGFSHCIGMCGPFVITQNANILAKTPIENFNQIKRLKNSALLPYHFGRIITYSFLGFCCAFLKKNIQNFTGFKILSVVFLTISALIFLQLFFDRKPYFLNRFKLPFKSRILEIMASFFLLKTKALMLDPQGLKGLILGLILGFIPCGMLYSAFLIAATFNNIFLAAFGMFLFGLATFPSLFFTAYGSGAFHKIPEFKFFIKVLILLNAIMLLMMAGKLI